MKSDDIRKLYAAERPATDEEARNGFHRMRTDPSEARAAIQTLAALAGEDGSFAMLLQLWQSRMIGALIAERIASDDAFAIEAGKILAELMEQTSRRTSRGRPRPTKSA